MRENILDSALVLPLRQTVAGWVVDPVDADRGKSHGCSYPMAEDISRSISDVSVD